MLFQIDRKSSVPIYKQIVKKMKNLTLGNILIPGEKIPSISELATLLVINPKNVYDAYHELAREGIIQTVEGQGFFVCPQMNPVKDEKKILEIKIQLGVLIEEAAALDLCEIEFTSWVHDYFHQVKKNTTNG